MGLRVTSGVRRGAVALALGALVLAGAVTAPAYAAPPGSAAHAKAGPAKGATKSRTPHRLTLTSLSNPRPQLVSGGDVLASVELPAGVRGPQVRVALNGHDVTRSFVPQDDGTLVGLVTGLRAGTNWLTATARGRGSAHLLVVDHSIDGPVISGRRQAPYYCQTTAFGLPAATPPTCSVPTQVSYEYYSTDKTFKPLADPTSPPADLATATVDGQQVPYIVRLEQGTIDRAVYQIAALYDGSDPSPTAPETGWNDRLVYTFGGGCNSGYRQGTTTGGVLDDRFLSKGYAVASSTLNVLDQNCSTVISAEAAMMVKEHFAETYGAPLFTMGWGGSGGAIQQYTIADAYPGILDGIVPGISFPDALTTLGPVTDCRLLNTFFAGDGSDFTAAQRRAVAGYNAYSTCTSWDASFANRITATDSCDPVIPEDVRWDPVTNPDGVICNASMQMINQIGTDPDTGFPNMTLDNVGVQYGLQALRDGVITPEQFVRLNASIGGFDYTGKAVPQRTVASTRGLRAAYADGLASYGSQGLRDTAIIDHRQDLDSAGSLYDIHTTEWSYVTRARLLARNGTAANQVIIESQPTADQSVAADSYILDEMDAWLTRVKADPSRLPLSAKVVKDRPGTLSDGCFLSATQLVHQDLTYPATGACAAAYPVASNPRLVAGQGLMMDQLKCRLTPLRRSAYPVSFTDDQWARLQAAFPTGVCDYRLPGVGERAPIAPWLSYGSDPDAVHGPVPVRAP
ncbi:DUF6351 family protein [Nocardioides cheoyonin]|uniref:DUF6351 family protein n=1 Tax=Nocardioides cheoyonin TaxID=3156615 RepID=UPI0032B5AEEF